ncbi:MAG: N-acetylmuramidase domain-containing protein [Candidatus Binatia bacterium]|nr:N-acetylmuramidase domain-containing protein [Candidatus Binatia bacterium]
MNFVGKGQPLTRQGLAANLDLLGLGPEEAAVLWAVIEVETAGVTQGFGFRVDRRPQMLFERHKFREFTGGRFNAVAPDISGPAGGYGPFALQYTKLEKALALCEQAGLGAEPALRSASWGLGQVMGFNCTAAGFGSAAAMVEAMVTGEDAQLAAMARFLQTNKLADTLVRKDWVSFAKRYNGKDYWKNKYDIKLGEQYHRFASGSLPNLEVRTAQAALFYLGYSPGKIDGILGARTRSALRHFRIAAGLPPGDELDGEVYTILCRKAALDP